MSQPNQGDYYARRAASSREAERQAASPSVAAIHGELARRYDGLLSDLAEQESQQAPDGAQAT